LLKNPENLTENQRTQLEYYVKANPVLYRAYLLKEKLRMIFRLAPDEAIRALDGWLAWAQRCRIPEFRALRAKIKRNRAFIQATLIHRMSTGKLEATNNIIKSIIRRSFGFRNVDNLIAMIYLRSSPVLPLMEENLFNLIG
jgi:transposase